MYWRDVSGKVKGEIRVGIIASRKTARFQCLSDLHRLFFLRYTVSVAGKRFTVFSTRYTHLGSVEHYLGKLFG